MGIEMKTFKLKLLSFLCLLFTSFNLFPQETTISKDSSALKNIEIEAFTDFYYSRFQLDESKNLNHSKLLSNYAYGYEFATNLTFLCFKLNYNNFRFKFTPAYGRFFNNTNLNIFELNLGVKLSKSKEIYLDAGIMESPLGNESPVSFNQITYTRSLAAEYVPYLINGVKLSWKVNEKFQSSIYLINSWLRLYEINKSKSLIFTNDFKLNKTVSIRHNLFWGNESIDFINPTKNYLFYNELAINTNFENGIKTGTCIYYGYLFNNLTNPFDEDNGYFQANLMASIPISKKSFLVGRIEYFENFGRTLDNSLKTNEDKDNIISGSLGYDYNLNPFFSIRAEARLFNSVYGVDINEDLNLNWKDRMMMFTCGLTYKLNRQFKIN